MRFTALSALSAVAVVLAASDAAAHLGHGVPRHVKARHEGRAMTPVRRAPSPAAPTDEPSAATNTVDAQECQPYSIPAVAALQNQFPTVWKTAQIVNGDTQAQQVWQSIQNSGIIPSDVKQKGSGGTGDFSSVTPSYPQNDPDCWWTDTQCVSPKHKGLNQDVWQCPEPETWGLTFDDGPNCSHNAFYDFLLEQKQKATLFYIGSNVMDWPLEAQRGIVEGHHICVHTWSHQYTTQLSNEQVFAELYYTGKAIKDVTGVTPRCWRPPYGDVDDRVRAIAQGLGMATYLWSDDTDDWQVKPLGTKPKASIVANYNSIINKDYSTHGNIVLTHEINAYTMKLAIDMYPTIKQHFKNIVPVTACYNETNPYPESITYPNFADYIAGNINATGLPAAGSIKVASASYDPLAAASQTAAANDTTGGSTSKQSKQAAVQGKTSGALSVVNISTVALGAVAAVAFMTLA